MQTKLSHRPLHVDLYVSVKDGHHIPDSDLPPGQSGLREAELLGVPDSLHQAWTLLVDGVDVIVQFLQ